MIDRVLIAGAGPVGLVCALALARSGIAVDIFERVPAAAGGRNIASRASTFHPPTLEILDALGVADTMLARGRRVDAIAWFNRDRRPIARLDLGLLAALTRFPFRLQYEQGWLTEVITQALSRERLARLHTGVEVLGARSDERGAELVVRNAGDDAGGSTRTERGSIVVAADGARSAVRDALNIAFEGNAYPARVLRVMTHANMPALVPGLEPVSYIYSEHDSVSLLEQPDCWRVVFRVPGEMSDADALAPARIAERIAAFLPHFDHFYADVYGTSCRLATNYRAGRVVLAGDAAHITNTRGGMNMNCGIHDAWELARGIVAIRDGADARQTLGDYADRRRSVALDQLIPRTDRNISVAGPQRLRELAAIAADDALARDFLVKAAMLDMAPANRRTLTLT